MSVQQQNPFMGRDDLLSLLAEVGKRLESQGLEGTIFLVGGAAIAIQYDTARLTQDLDAVFQPKNEVYEAARQVGEEHGLSDDWLNDAVKGLVPASAAEDAVGRDLPGLHLMIARPEVILAMKVSAARSERDARDIRFLAGKCGLRTPEEVLDMAERVWGSQAAWALQPKSRFMVEQAMNPPRERGLSL